MKKQKKHSLDHIMNMKIPKNINPNDTLLLKKLVSKSFLQKGCGKWFNNGGYDVIMKMDNTIVGLS